MLETMDAGGERGGSQPSSLAGIGEAAGIGVSGGVAILLDVSLLG